MFIYSSLQFQLHNIATKITIINMKWFAFMCIRVNIMADISENLIFPLSKLRAL